MPNSLILPSLRTLEEYEGLGNYAIKKYYTFPYRYFYRHKLQMIVDMIGSDYYYNILDLGSGPGIFLDELKKHSVRVKLADRIEEVKDEWKFDAVVCASYLEFVDLEPILFKIHKITKRVLYVASPMKNPITDLYYKLIGDTHIRNSHSKIRGYISKRFVITEYNTWNNLYFSLKAFPKP
jgi:hypothetical protein